MIAGSPTISLLRLVASSMVTCIGPLATIYREPGQARKGAAAAVDSGAGVWLVQVATLNICSYGYPLQLCGPLRLCGLSYLGNHPPCYTHSAL